MHRADATCWRRWQSLLLAIMLIGVASTIETWSAKEASADEIKAAFLYNFIKFVEWPDAAFHTDNPDLTIGILGEGSTGDALESLSGKLVNGRPILLRRFAGLDEVEACHVLFVPRSRRADLRAVLARVSDSPVLTIGDGEGFAARGGMIALTRAGSRVRFEINLGAARAANLEISSKLLRLAIRVYVGEQEGS